MKFLIENWYVIVALLAVLECIIYAVYRFLKLPTKAQAEKVKAWLLWAVTNAEKAEAAAGVRFVCTEVSGCGNGGFV